MVHIYYVYIHEWYLIVHKNDLYTAQVNHDKQPQIKKKEANHNKLKLGHFYFISKKPVEVD